MRALCVWYSLGDGPKSVLADFRPFRGALRASKRCRVFSNPVLPILQRQNKTNKKTRARRVS